MSSDDDARSVGEFLMSPLGGGAVFLFFAPLGGCATKLQYGLLCPSGEQQNLFGSTLGGVVGTVDYEGAGAMALVVGFLIYLAVS
jgi:hypothetical protein